MKNLFKKVVTIGALAGAFVTGYFVNESDNVKMEAPVQAETQVQQTVNNNIKNGINEIESGERNVFTQYFTITKIDEKGTDVQNQYNENDTYYINKEEYDLDFNDLKVGTKIAVTFDHDTTITAELDYRYIGQYKLVSAKDYNVDIDETQYIYGVNNDKPSDTIILEKQNHNVGDLVNVTFENENSDSIKKVEKIGKWKEQENQKSQVENENDSFTENKKNDVNKDNPDYVQTEDGSFVKKDFWY
ncbi:hypothetical protein PQE66_gp009 [Bacillus phage PBC2]|uniref:Uncharacterized protein n=1 Tax=Bacillus phage PBC2 TaxID=1675029 RepID=A0A218KBQ3_9CAUD|nr:hypothetical protein PQE66_gp009 [Bacillus phage PBC2]AKQ08324.1 hypothetical protein PBC2_009 [Bacillus phage PBC2]